MPTVFVKCGTYFHGVKGYSLIREAALKFIKINKPEKYNIYANDVNLMNIEVYQKGKPYFEELPVEFSVSHSDEIWVCVMDENPCGIDIQKIKQCEYIKLSERFYTANEHEYVIKKGIDGFFDIWTMREALGKLSGEGFFFPGMPEMIEKGNPISNAVFNGETYNFKKLYIQYGYKCTLCSRSSLNPEVITI